MTELKVFPRGMEVPRVPGAPANSWDGAAVEALTSYVLGLARSHHVRPRRLCEHLMRDHGARGWTRISQHIGQINGWGLWAASASQSIDQFALSRCAQSMTLLGADAFVAENSKRLLRRSRAWCPRCYLDQRANGQDSWDSLYTYLHTAEVCLLHRVSLRSSCPNCRASQPFIPRLPFLDNCDTCGADLAVAADTLPLGRSWLEQRLWTARCGEQLIRALHSGELLSVENLHKNLRAIAGVHFNGHVVSMSVALGLPKYLLNILIRTYQLVPWQALVELSYKFQVGADRLLSPQVEITHPEQWKRWSQILWISKEDWREQVRRALAEELANSQAVPLRPLEVCRMLGVRMRSLIEQFPEETFQLAARHRAWLEEQPLRVHLRLEREP